MSCILKLRLFAALLAPVACAGSMTRDTEQHPTRAETAQNYRNGHKAKVVVGMSERQLIEEVGPCSNNYWPGDTVTTAYGVHTAWIFEGYKHGRSEKMYVYLTNNIVTSFVESIY